MVLIEEWPLVWVHLHGKGPRVVACLQTFTNIQSLSHCQHVPGFKKRCKTNGQKNEIKKVMKQTFYQTNCSLETNGSPETDGSPETNRS